MQKTSLQHSWVLAAILSIAHGAAIALVVAVDVPLWVKLAAVAALSGNLFIDVWRWALLRTPDAVIAVEITSDDQFSIQTRGGEWVECEVLGSTYVMSLLAVLNLKQTDGGASRRVIILPDSIDADDFRKLRVWLRWKAGRQSA